MNKSIKLKDFYVICLILSLVLNIINTNLVPIGSYITLIRLLLFSFAFLAFVLSRSQVKKTDIALFIVLSVLQFFGYLYSRSTNYLNSSYLSGITFIISYFLFVRFPTNINMNANQKDIYLTKLMKIIFFVAVISSIYAMLFQLGGNIFSFRNSSNFNISNVYCSFWGHRNQFATILLGGFLAAIYLHQDFMNKKIYYIFTFIFLANIVLTLSRTVFVAVFAFFLCYLICQWKTRKKYVIIISLLALTIVLMYLYIPSIRSFTDKYMIRSDSGLTGREYLWELALSLIDLPTVLFGRGSGIDRIVLTNDNVSAGVGFHNMYLTYIISVGIIVLIIMVVSTIKLIIKLRRNYAKNNILLFSWTVGCIASMMSYGMFEASLFFGLYPAPMLMMLFVFTIPAILTSSQSK